MDEWLIQAMGSVADPVTKDAFTQKYMADCGFVIARPTDFDRRLREGGVVDALCRVGVVQGLLEAFGPRGVQREADAVVVVTHTREQALHLGLTLIQFKEANPVSVAVGAGEVLVGPNAELHGCLLYTSPSPRD